MAEQDLLILGEKIKAFSDMERKRRIMRQYEDMDTIDRIMITEMTAKREDAPTNTQARGSFTGY